jgi:hypothetical protein
MITREDQLISMRSIERPDPSLILSVTKLYFAKMQIRQAVERYCQTSLLGQFLRSTLAPSSRIHDLQKLQAYKAVSRSPPDVYQDVVLKSRVVALQIGHVISRVRCFLMVFEAMPTITLMNGRAAFP